MQEMWVRSLGREDLLEKKMSIHFSILACKIPWTEEPDRLLSMGSQRVEHPTHTHTHTQFLSSRDLSWRREQEGHCTGPSGSLSRQRPRLSFPHRLGLFRVTHLPEGKEEALKQKHTQLSRFLWMTSDHWVLAGPSHWLTLYISSLCLCFLVGKMWMLLTLWRANERGWTSLWVEKGLCLEKCTAVTLSWGCLCAELSVLGWRRGPRLPPALGLGELRHAQKVGTAVCARCMASSKWFMDTLGGTVFSVWDGDSKATCPSLGTPQPRISLLNGGWRPILCYTFLDEMSFINGHKCFFFFSVGGGKDYVFQKVRQRAPGTWYVSSQRPVIPPVTLPCRLLTRTCLNL